MNQSRENLGTHRRMDRWTDPISWEPSSPGWGVQQGMLSAFQSEYCVFLSGTELNEYTGDFFLKNLKHRDLCTNDRAEVILNLIIGRVFL